MAIRNKITKQGKDVPSKLSESYARAVEEIRKRSEKFREEFSKTMQDFVGEQKTALEQIIEVVDGGGKQKENQNALERFLFGENSEQIFQKQLKAYETYMESAEAIKERYADDAEKQKAALYLLKENKKVRKCTNLNNFVEEIVVEIKRKICEWQSLLKYAIFAM